MLTVSRILELYKGSSFPTRIQASDGNIYILKMKGAGNGIRSLLQEFLVNRVGHLIGCHVPNAHPILIPDQFPWTFGTDEFDDLVKKSFGMNLALEFIESQTNESGIDPYSLNEEIRNQTIAMDFFFKNYDRTIQSNNFLKDQGERFGSSTMGAANF